MIYNFIFIYMNIFAFKKFKKGYRYSLSGKTAYYFYESFGFPIEMYIEEMERIKKEELERLFLKLKIDWINFIIKNNIQNPKLLGMLKK